MRLMTKQYGPRDLRQACAMPREDAIWIMEHCADAWEAERQEWSDALAKNQTTIVQVEVANAALRKRLEETP